MNQQIAGGTPPHELIITNRHVLGIAVPMTLAYLTTPLLGIVDTAVVGQLNDPALLGGLAVGAITFDVVFGTFNALRSGTTGLVAQAFGRGNQSEEAAVLLRALALAMIAGVILMLLTPGIIAGSNALISPESDVAAAMALYVGIRMLAAPLTLINYSLLGYVLGRGEGGFALVLQLILNGINIALSVYLGLSLGWGIEGVAWGTVAGELVAVITGLAVVYWRLRGKVSVPLRQVFDLVEMRKMLTLNGDIMVRSFALLGAFALFSRQGAQLGTVTLAANAILMNLFLIAGYFLDGFATAAEQLAGRALGAGQGKAFRRAVKLASVWGFVLAFGLAAVFLLAGNPFIHLLTNSEPVRQAAIAYLPWAALTAVSGVLAFQMDGVFIGATWSRDMRNMMLLSLALYGLCLWAFGSFLGNVGLWVSLHIFLIARGLSLAAILPVRLRQTFG